MLYTDLLKPATLKKLCFESGFEPSKSFGQNYLITDRPIKAMIETAHLERTDTIIEIGPGFGVLTLALAERVQKVISFEIEQTLLEYWQEQQKEYPNIDIVWGDVLHHITKKVFELSQDKKQTSKKNSEIVHNTPYKVIANLPYQITARAIRTILELDPLPEIIVLMVQKEVATRICAPLGGKHQKGQHDTEVGILSVAVQYYGQPRLITHVSKGCFWPSPNVDSAVIAIEHLRSRPGAEAFFRVVRAGFAHKRKILASNLAGTLNIPSETVRQIIRDITGNEKIRAEQLTVDQWEKIVHQLIQ